MLDVILIIVSALCMIAGLAGCVLPFLPGPPIAYLGLVFLHFTDKVHYTPTQLIIWLLIVAVVQVLDYGLLAAMSGQTSNMCDCRIEL